MALPTVFANATTATGQELDDDFNAVGATGSIRSVASGTNTITLVPIANSPAVTAYGTGYPLRFGFVAAVTSTGSVTARINALTFLKVYLPSGVQAGSGDILTGVYYEVVYVSSYDSGSGGWVITSALPTGSIVEIGNTRNLNIANNSGTPSTKIDITATSAILATSAGTPLLASSASVTIDLTTVGANGMDTGGRPTSGWVYLYLISNGSATAGLASATSPTVGSPSFPSGYIYSTYVGAMYCDGSQNLLRSRQRGNRAQYVVVASTNTAICPVIANGVAGTYSATTPTLAAVTVTGNSGKVPLTAAIIVINASNAYGSGSLSNVIIAPNTAWGGTNNGPAGSAGQIYPCYLPNTAGHLQQLQLMLEAATIAWAADAAGGGISCGGWFDGWSR